LLGGSFARALPGGSPTGAAAAALGFPGDRPPAVPAVPPRCRARQQQDQAVTVASGAPITGEMSQRPGRNAAHCPDRPLQRQGHL